jgi:hypothetical protein
MINRDLCRLQSGIVHIEILAADPIAVKSHRPFALLIQYFFGTKV